MRVDSTSTQKLFDLKDRVAIITGGAGFLGKQHTAALAEAGCNVVLWELNEDALNQALKEFEGHFPGLISGTVVDISSLKSIEAATQAHEKKWKKLDILINNAGMTVARGQEKFKKY